MNETGELKRLLQSFEVKRSELPLPFMVTLGVEDSSLNLWGFLVIKHFKQTDFIRFHG